MTNYYIKGVDFMNVNQLNEKLKNVESDEH